MMILFPCKYYFNIFTSKKKKTILNLKTPLRHAETKALMIWLHLFLGGVVIRGVKE